MIHFSEILKYHHSQVSPNLGEIVFQCPHVRMSFQLRLGAEPEQLFGVSLEKIELWPKKKQPEVLVDPIHPSVVFHLRHPVQSTPTCPLNISFIMPDLVLIFLTAPLNSYEN